MWLEYGKEAVGASYFSMLYTFLVSILDIFYERVPFLFFIMSNINDISKSGERKKRQEKKIEKEGWKWKVLTVVLYILLYSCAVHYWRGDASRKRITESISQYIFRNSCVIKVISKINISFTSFFIISHII
jgi:hypothetical protein